MSNASILSPTPDVPWSVDAVSAAPESVVIAANKQPPVAASSHGPWHCVATKQETTQEILLSLWFTDAHASLQVQKFNKNVLTLSHPKLQHSCHLALTTSPVDDVLFLYVASSDSILLWKVTRKDLTRSVPLSACASCYVPLDHATQNNDVGSETVSALTATWLDETTLPMILLGTSLGNAFWIRQSLAPMALEAQAIMEDHTASSSSLFSKFVYSALGTTSPSKEPIVQLLIVSSTTIYVDTNLSRTEWTCTQTDTSRMIFTKQRHEPWSKILDTNNSIASSSRVLYRSCLTTDSTCNTKQTHMLVLTHYHDDDKPSRLHWLVVDNTTYSMRHSFWLDRFVHPQTVTCLALVAAKNQAVYAALQQQPDHAIIFMCLHHEQLLELDTEPLVMMDRSLWTMSRAGFAAIHVVTPGVGWRVRMVVSAPVSPSSKRASTTTLQPNYTLQTTLMLHLKSSLTLFLQHGTTSLPPSLTRAEMQDLQGAVLSLANKQLESSTSAVNPMEAHHVLVDFLQQTGLYHDKLSAVCRHALMTMGQQVAAYYGVVSSISNRSLISPWEKKQLVLLESQTPNHILEWLGSVQTTVLTQEGEDRRQAYVDWLCLALQEAKNYREANRSIKYDLLSLADEPVESDNELAHWTITLPALLQQLVWYWKDHGLTAHRSNVQIVVPSALEACLDHYSWTKSPAVKEQYTQLLQVGIELMRVVKVEDEFVRDLCLQHQYFGGLCQLARDHEIKSDCAKFALDKYFVELAAKVDLPTGLPFDMFVLKWYSDRNWLGHVLNYGKLCPDALSDLMMKEEKLQPYRWILSIRNRDYNGATENLLSSVEPNKSTLKEAKRNLATAKLMNAIVVSESAAFKDTALQRQVAIEKKRELVNAQSELLGKDGCSDRQVVLYSPHQLLQMAMEQLQQATRLDDKIQACFRGLAICSSLERSTDCTSMAASVWVGAVVSDENLWKEWLETTSNYSALKARVWEESVFGGLVAKCESVGSVWDTVKYGPAMETQVFSQLGIQDEPFRAGLARLLHSAATKQ